MNRCQKCGGKLFIDGMGYTCLQCGCLHDLNGQRIAPRDPKIPVWRKPALAKKEDKELTINNYESLKANEIPPGQE